MTSINNNVVSPKADKQTNERINALCEIILVNEDILDLDNGKKYIEEHINNNIVLSADKGSIRIIVQNKIAQYIDQCPSTAQLFAFASNNRYHKFCRDFVEHYYHYYYSTSKPHSSLIFPVEFNYIFDCIQEAIDFHTLYEKFSIKMADDAVERAKKEASEASEKAAIAAKLAAKNAEKAANEAASKAVENSIEQVIEAKKLDERITESVDKQMGRVTSRMSETSATILGIFAAIVLTAVAGLFYSSSVISNLAKADLCKLICISSLVGMVCIDLISFLFYFIEKIKDSSSTFRLKKFLVISNIALLCLALVFGFYSDKHPKTNTSDDNQYTSESSTPLDEPCEPSEIVST